MSKFTAQTARFCELAKRGSHPGASTGERTAHKLASALHKVGDDIMLLDAEAIQGFCHLVHLAGGPFYKDEEKVIVYNTIEKSAGH